MELESEVWEGEGGRGRVVTEGAEVVRWLSSGLRSSYSS